MESGRKPSQTQMITLDSCSFGFGVGGTAGAPVLALADARGIAADSVPDCSRAPAHEAAALTQKAKRATATRSRGHARTRAPDGAGGAFPRRSIVEQYQNLDLPM